MTRVPARRDRFVRAAILVIAAFLPFGAALSCSQTAAPPDPDSGRNGVCADGLAACGAGICRDLDVDPNHCGGCNLGTCSEACGAGLMACGAACVDVQTSSANCGACGTLCPAGASCSGGVCSGGGSGGTGSGGTAGSAGSGTGATDGGAGSGYQVGTTCFPACASDASDPDAMGVRDGYGYEMGRSCVVVDSAPSLGVARCEPPPIMMPDSGIPPGDGFYIGTMCFPRCASDASDPDATGVRDGYGYEMGRSCIVVGSVPTMGVPTCVPPAPPTGDGWLVDMKCVPACTHPEWVEDAQGYGFEAQQTCIVTGSTAATQNARCTLTPRTDLPPPGSGFQNGGTCFPPCGTGATELTADGYGWEMNRTCIVPGSKGAVQGVPCVPPPSTVTGDCPRTLACPVVNSVTIACGCTWVDGLAERKAVIMGSPGATQYFLASAMLETVTLTADYTLGDGKTEDAFNAGLAKQNWGMIRRCHPAWQSQTAAQFMTSTAMNSSLALDVQVYNECRSIFGEQWWAGHRNGYNNLNTNTQDIQEFKAGMDWTNTQLTGHLTDDVRFWVTIRPI